MNTEPAEPRPQFEDFPSYEAYVEAFHAWRARQRDGRLNDEERAARFEVIEAAIMNRPRV